MAKCLCVSTPQSGYGDYGYPRLPCAPWVILSPVFHPWLPLICFFFCPVGLPFLQSHISEIVWYIAEEVSIMPSRLASCVQESSMLLHILEVHSFFLLGFPFYGNTSFNIRSPLEGHLGCFQFGAVSNKVQFQ